MENRLTEKSRVYCGIYIAAAVIAAVAAFGLVGCGALPRAELSARRIELFVGESRDIFPYVDFLPPFSSDKAVALRSDGDCLQIDGSVVTAVKSGECTLEARYFDSVSELEVVVRYRDAREFGLEASGLVQTAKSIGDIKPVEFAVFQSEYADPETPIVWRVDGVAVDNASREFLFLPAGYGEFAVTAEAAGLRASESVRVYRPTKTELVVDGLKAQGASRSEVVFYADERSDPDNPPSVYEWRLNGADVSNSPVFSFTPDEAGEYEIALYVNGAAAGSVTVTASGERALACRVEYDDEDGVFVAWDDGEVASRVTVISPDGKRRDVSSGDAQYSYLFEPGRFDASEYIDVCSEKPGAYTVTVQTSAVSECRFEQFGTEARAYFDDVPFMKNMFISSVLDGEETAEDLYASGIRTHKCYTVLTEAELQKVAAYAHVALGAELTISLDGNIAEFEFSGELAPQYREEIQNVLRMYSEFPHIEYDGAKRRRTTHVFASDRRKKSVGVSRSEQLYLAVSRGYRPLPAAGSTAEKIYASAKNRLLAFIGADYDDEQKVHAIYDWLQWVSIMGDNDPKSAANYLEALFGSVEIEGGDVRRAVVSKFGMAKSFAFLCGIEGIDCGIITDGRDYRNTVTLDGATYNIDVSGGKASSAELGITRRAELDTHRMLFADDAAVETLGLFDASSAARCVHGGKSYYSQKTKMDGVYFDKTLKARDNDYADIKAAVFDAFSRSYIGAVSVPVLAGVETYMNNAFGAEFKISGELDNKREEELFSLLRRVAGEYVQTAYGRPVGSVTLYRAGNNVHMSATVSAENVG